MSFGEDECVCVCMSGSSDDWYWDNICCKGYKERVEGEGLGKKIPIIEEHWQTQSLASTPDDVEGVVGRVERDIKDCQTTPNGRIDMGVSCMLDQKYTTAHATFRPRISL